jgi:transmembrane sensor
MGNSDRDDPIWDTAWAWVVREHERSLDSDAQRDLIRWLKADPAHLKTYEEASRIWLLSGLLPPSDDFADPE